MEETRVIGEGFNSPPGHKESQGRCHFSKSSFHPKITDKTCCVHAEQRAIFDALARNPELVRGARLYFVRVDENGEPRPSGRPYCTYCSKLALDVGITEFVLLHEYGIYVYGIEEYNNLSFAYEGDSEIVPK